MHADVLQWLIVLPSTLQLTMYGAGEYSSLATLSSHADQRDLDSTQKCTRARPVCAGHDIDMNSFHQCCAHQESHRKLPKSPGH